MPLKSDTVEAASRTLLLLEELNRHRVTSIDRLHRATELPKSTVVRLMKSLCALGYAANDPRQGGYAVASRVKSLSNGFHGDPLVAGGAGAGARLSGILSGQRAIDAARHAGPVAGGRRQARHRTKADIGFAGHDPQARICRTRPDGRTALVEHDRAPRHRQPPRARHRRHDLFHLGARPRRRSRALRAAGESPVGQYCRKRLVVAGVEAGEMSRQSAAASTMIGILCTRDGIVTSLTLDRGDATYLVARMPMSQTPKPGRPVRGSRTGVPVMALPDLLGRRWTLGVLWNLSNGGPCTF